MAQCMDCSEYAAMKVAVCVATRGRPHMLFNALCSLAKIERPSGAELVFVVVENDHAPNCRGIVDGIRSNFEGCEVHYLLEENIGIPAARNTAVGFAVSMSANVVAFIDDDEVVDSGWLVELLSTHRSSGALLLGGPVLAATSPNGATMVQRLIHSSIARRYLRKANRASRLSAKGHDHKVTITTGNWFGSTELFTRYGLRFDEKMRLSGGSDAAFFAEVRALKIRVRWVPNALAYETIPGERLDSRYQLRRAFDQSTTSFRRKLLKSKLHATSLLVTLPLRAIGVAVLAIAIIPTCGLTYLSTLRGVGWMAGRIAAVFGREAALYADVTGD